VSWKDHRKLILQGVGGAVNDLWDDQKKKMSNHTLYWGGKHGGKDKTGVSWGKQFSDPPKNGGVQKANKP